MPSIKFDFSLWVPIFERHGLSLIESECLMESFWRSCLPGRNSEVSFASDAVIQRRVFKYLFDRYERPVYVPNEFGERIFEDMRSAVPFPEMPDVLEPNVHGQWNSIRDAQHEYSVVLGEFIGNFKNIHIMKDQTNSSGANKPEDLYYDYDYRMRVAILNAEADAKIRVMSHEHALKDEVRKSERLWELEQLESARKHDLAARRAGNDTEIRRIRKELSVVSDSNLNNVIGLLGSTTGNLFTTLYAEAVAEKERRESESNPG